MKIQRAGILITFMTIALQPLQLWAIDCEGPDKFYELANKAGAKQDFETASKWLKRSVENCAQFDNLFRLGRSEQRLGRLTTAVEAYTQALEKAGDEDSRANTFGRYGEVLALNGQRRKALIMLQTASSIHSAPPPQWMTTAARELDESLVNKPMTKEDIKRGLGGQQFGLLSVSGVAKATGSAGSSVMKAQRSVDVPLNFEFNSSKLDGLSEQNVSALAEALSDATYAGENFKLIGHSDVRGGADYNRGLSLDRANTVKDILIQLKPSLAGRIETGGAGEDDPVSFGASEKDHWLNRRLQVLIK